MGLWGMLWSELVSGPVGLPHRWVVCSSKGINLDCSVQRGLGLPMIWLPGAVQMRCCDSVTDKNEQGNRGVPSPEVPHLDGGYLGMPPEWGVC